jgi:peptidoglycan/LPS O-acetylase OafA/YrhL
MDTKQEITDLTYCRALFAAWVFIYHVDLHARFPLGPLAGLFHRGYLGVDGFFLLSGLILARVHPEMSNSASTAFRFWGKRLARIYPVHLAVLVLLTAIVTAGLTAGIAPRDPSRFTVVSLLENVLLVQGWGFGNSWAWNYPAWSVSTEWAGYLLFPAIWLGMGYCNAFVIGQIAILCFPILGLISFLSGHGLNVSFADALPRFLTEFVWGICTARIVPLFADNLPTVSMTWIGAATIFISVLLGLDALAVVGLWLVLMSVTMQSDAERPPVFGRFPFLRALGLLSYSFYMSFATIELLLAQWFRHQGWDPAGHRLVYTIAMTVLTLGLSMVLHVLVERPCKRAADRWLAASAPLAAGGAGM